MGKVIAFLGVSLVMVWAMPARAQQAPDAFNDVPTDHWAYQAVENLRAKNIVIGYPDGYFRGKRTLTRYEFAVALDRALRSLPEPQGGGGVGPAGTPGEPGPAGPAGPAGPPGMTPEEVAQLKRLAEEFRNELAGLGNSIASINRRLDDLAKRVADIEADLRNRVKITGGAFVGVRSDRAKSNYVDQDGALLTPFNYYYDGRGYGNASNFRNSPGVVHSLQLGALANLPGGGVLDAALMTGNYKNYLDGTTAQGWPYRYNDPESDTYVHHLMVTVPMPGLGEASKLTVGRFGHNVSPYTLWKPTIDSYFDNPLEEDGKIYMDGAIVNTGIGSVGVELFGGKTSSVRGTGDSGWWPWSAPLAGASRPAMFHEGYYPAENGYGAVHKPFSQVGNEGYYDDYMANMQVGELAGLTLGLPLNSMGGKVRFTTIAAADGGWQDYYYYKSNPFTNVLVLGADAAFQLGERTSVTGHWGKTITGEGRFRSVNTGMNNAFDAAVNLGLGSLNVTAGYKYVDPLFYAPGYWGRIGNWINPTNIQGPTVRASFGITPSVMLTAGGDFLSAARNYEGSLTRNDDINRVLVGLKWDMSPVLRTSLDWEGVYWNLGADGVLMSPDGVHPTEHYITFGADWNLTSNTILKLKYQIGTYDGHDAMYVAGMGRYSFNSFTSQVAVRF